MTRISDKRHRFPPAVIQLAVWLHFRFTLSFRDVEEMLAHRDVDVSYEKVRAWTLKFGQKIAANLRRRKMPPITALASRRDGFEDRWRARVDLARR